LRVFQFDTDIGNAAAALSDGPYPLDRRAGEALVLRVLDSALALQPADGPHASFAADDGLRIRVLQEGFRKVLGTAGPCQHRRITITADHGEVFGEDGYVGHGPVLHEKVYEVPFIEGKLR
jgi:hypothetical protein